MLATFLIGLREGLEAAIIISILATYTVKIGQKNRVPAILYGAGLAVVLAICIGFGLSTIESRVSRSIEITITGTTTMCAVVLVTWMIFWMARHSRSIAAELKHKVDNVQGSGLGSLFGLAFLSVIREGVETSILIWSTAKTTAASGSVFGGAFLGLLTAAGLGFLIYKGALRVNLKWFFSVTSAYLIVIAAGIFSYGLGEFQELGILNFLNSSAYDLTNVLPQGSIGELVLNGTIAFNNNPTVLQALGWALYLVPVSLLYWRVTRSKSSATN